MKKKKETPYLDLYYRIIERGELINGNGLCNERVEGVCLDEHSSFQLFVPDDHRKRKAYWASNYTNIQFCRSIKACIASQHEFTETRQNIILLLAAINDEL